MRPRCVVTVRSRTPRREAICRAVSPSAATSSTWRSRCVSVVSTICRRSRPSAIAPTHSVGGPARTISPAAPRRRDWRNSTGSELLSRKPSAPMNKALEIDKGSAFAPHPSTPTPGNRSRIVRINQKESCSPSRPRPTRTTTPSRRIRRTASRASVVEPASARTSMSGRSSMSSDRPARTTGRGSTTMTPRRRLEAILARIGGGEGRCKGSGEPDQAEVCGLGQGLNPVRRAELAVQLGHVSLDRACGDDEPAGRLAHRQAPAEELEDLALPGRDGRSDVGGLPGAPDEAPQALDGRALLLRREQPLAGGQPLEADGDGPNPGLLLDVAVDARPDAFEEGLVLPPSGEDEDARRLRGVAPQPPRHLQPIHVRERQVQQDQVGSGRPIGLQRLLPGGGLRSDLQPVGGFARYADHTSKDGVILHDQDASRDHAPGDGGDRGSQGAGASRGHQTGRDTEASPNRHAMVTASIFECTPSLARMLFTWLWTVSGLIRSSSAISPVVSPEARARRISVSRAVRRRRASSAIIAGSRPIRSSSSTIGSSSSATRTRSIPAISPDTSALGRAHLKGPPQVSEGCLTSRWGLASVRPSIGNVGLRWTFVMAQHRPRGGP